MNLQTHTAVSTISKSTDPASVYPWRVETPRGAVAAKQVVLATNAYTSALVPQFKDKIVPVRGTCCHIAVPPASAAPRLTKTYTLRWGGWDYDYLIPRGDGSIVVGGARSSFIDKLDNWYDVSDDSRVLESAVRYFDGYMQRNFVGWEDSHAYTDRVWTGSKCIPVQNKEKRQNKTTTNTNTIQSWAIRLMDCHMSVTSPERGDSSSWRDSLVTACRRYSLQQRASRR